MLASFFVNSTQTRVIGEEGTSVEIMPLKDLAIGKPKNIFLI